MATTELTPFAPPTTDDEFIRLPEEVRRDVRRWLRLLATIDQVPSTSLGVTRFGQSGSLEDVYRYHGIDADSIVRAGLDVATS